MFKKLSDAALSLKEKADIGKRVEATKQFASDKYEASKAGASATWDKHWPAVEHLLVEGLLTVAEEKLCDEKTIESVFSKLYETLPLAARFVLSRDRFLKVTMARRDSLLLKVQHVRAQRAGQSAQARLEAPKDTDV